ncbi:MAG: hypothetical protein ACOX8M_04300 [Marvinbryantia sp.]|jgi:hypothetical protein
MDNQQYKWRQRKKRNLYTTVWICLVILFSVIGTFVYEGTRAGDPLAVAKKYIKDTTGAEVSKVETGDRSLNADNQFVQEYTLTYTADGKEVQQKMNMVQQNEKKYGLFEQWDVASAAADSLEVEITAPAGSQVLVDGVRPDESMLKEDEALSPGAVCYQLTGVADGAELQVNGLPFESYKGTIDAGTPTVDVRNYLTVSENAKVQMEELGKGMINQLLTAVVEQKGADKLGSDFSQVPNKENLYRVMTGNLIKDDVLQVKSISLDGFKPEFGEVYYPGKGEEAYIGIEMKLKYNVSYEPAELSEEETETAEESESESETETEAAKKTEKEATFYFKYIDGKCMVTSAEVPGVI